MRENDDGLHPKALEREREKRFRFWWGMVLSAAGLVAVFVLHEVYIGFAVAMIGAGIVPFGDIASVFKR